MSCYLLDLNHYEISHWFLGQQSEVAIFAGGRVCVKGSQSGTVMRSVSDGFCFFESNFWVTKAVVIIV